MDTLSLQDIEKAQAIRAKMRLPRPSKQDIEYAQLRLRIKVSVSVADYRSSEYWAEEKAALEATQAWVAKMLAPPKSYAPPSVTKAKAGTHARKADTYRCARRNTWRAQNATARQLKKVRKEFGLTRSQYDRLRQAAASLDVQGRLPTTRAA